MVDYFNKYNIKVQDNSIAIVGWEEGQAGRVHSWLEKSEDYHVACFVNWTDEPLSIDENCIDRHLGQFSYPTNNTFKNKPLINSSNWANYIKKYGLKKALITIEDPYIRNEQIQYAIENDIELINAIHPSVSVMEDAIFENNIIIHAGALIGYKAEICFGTFISYGSIINHHCALKDCSTIDAGVTLAGNVSVGRFATIHTGASVINKITIGDSSVLGAGTVVIRDVPDNTTVVGVPGKKIKK